MPKLIPVSYSLRRLYVDEFYNQHICQLDDGSRVLDLGGHKSTKRGNFNVEQSNLRVIYLNLSPSKGTDVQADAALLPFSKDQFDALICSELLEHVPDPLSVLRQIHNVLRPDGKLLISVPFLYRIHADPYDYGRYTDYYWRENLEKFGFDNITIAKQGFFYSVFFDFLRQYSNYMNIPQPFGRLIRWLISLVLTPLQSWSLRHEKKENTQKNKFITSFTTGFGITAHKPGDCQSSTHRDELTCTGK